MTPNLARGESTPPVKRVLEVTGIPKAVSGALRSGTTGPNAETIRLTTD